MVKMVEMVEMQDHCRQSPAKLGEQAKQLDHIWAADTGIVNRKSRDIPEEVGKPFLKHLKNRQCFSETNASLCSVSLVISLQ